MGIVALGLLIICIIETCILLQKKIEEILPVALCALILIMQVLGMLQMLSSVIIVLGVFVIILGCKIWYKGRLGNLTKTITESIRCYIFTLGLLIILETVVLCIVLQYGRIVGTFDEFNFWATAVKSLWHNNGFAEAKDMWAIWEYPQAMPLFQWFGIYIKGRFSDDVLYILRLIFDFSFIISLLSRINVKWYFTPLISILIIIFPSVANATSYATLSVDGDLAILFGYTLCCIWDRKKSDFYYYFRIAVLLCTIILTKSLSFVWVGYLLFFLIILELFEMQNNDIKWSKKDVVRKYGCIGLCILMPLIAQISWSLFLNATGNRSVQSVSAIIPSIISNIFAGKWSLSGYEKELIFSFIKAFFTRPASYMLGGKNGFLTPFLIMVICFTVFRYVAKKQKINLKLKKLFYMYFLLVSISYFLIFLLTMCTVMFGEMQKYSNVDGIALACGRYCAPVFLGFLLFVFHLFIDWISVDLSIEKEVRQKTCIWGIILTIICSNVSALKSICWIIPSVKDNGQKALERMEQQTYENFSWAKLWDGYAGKKKVYWITDNYLDMAYVYILYPIMIHRHEGYFASIGEFQNYIYSSGCQYLYYDSSTGDSHIIELLNLMLGENQQVEVGGLYKIDMSHVNFQLQRITQ